jgi:ArsR family transcriptional regulator
MTPEEASRCCGPLDEQLDAQLFKALGDPTRLRLLTCLAKCGRPCSVTELSACCQVDFSVVSRHLAVLARAGVLGATKSGRTVWYEVRYRTLAQAFRALARSVDRCRPKKKIHE